MKTPARKKKSWPIWVKLLLSGVVVLIVIGAAVLIYTGDNLLNNIRNYQPPAAKNEQPACGAQATSLGLATGHASVDKPAYFSTDGSDVFVSAQGFYHGTFAPTKGSAQIWVGDASNPPVLQKGSYDKVANSKVYALVDDSNYRKLQLPAGHYWIWTNDASDLVLAGCGQISGQQPNGDPATK